MSAAAWGPTPIAAGPQAAPLAPPTSTWPGWVPPAEVTNLLGLVAAPAMLAVQNLAPARGVAPGPCASFQVAPSVWVAAPCGELARGTFLASPALPIRQAIRTTSLPESVDLRQSGLDGPIKDQAQVGVCFAFALSTVIENGLRRAGRSDVVAPLHVISSDAWYDLQRGRSSKALTTEASWAYRPVKACKLEDDRSDSCSRAYGVQAGSWRSDPELVAEVERANASGFARALRAQRLRAPVDPDDVAGILATGQALYASIQLDMNAWGHKAKGGAEIPDWDRGESGHGVALVGFRSGPAGRQFLVHNSWSEHWRDHGYAWMSEAMLRRHTNDAFTLEVSTTSGDAPEVGKIPPISGQGQACGPGLVRDALLGTCAQPCAGGGPPVASLCAPGAAAPPRDACPGGGARDVVTQVCSPRCKSGAPAVGGVCVF